MSRKLILFFGVLLRMSKVRTRFAPAPTGIMHIGNIRTALLNYIFTQQYQGACILRIEDTDEKRNIDPQADQLIQHLTWMQLSFQEGPHVGGPYAPYFQSQRQPIYEQYLKTLQEKNLIYRCFASPEELETKRQRQLAMKQPPRYDRAYANLTPEQIQAYLDAKTPFVWRLRIDSNKLVSFADLARGTLTFDLKNFSDFPLTRQDGSFTFIFANCIDDIEMKISHVFRGEEHLSNTVHQIVLYQLLQAPLPIFWHTPILFNTNGKKLSKRDRGFSLEDLKNQGFLPEAINNYLMLIGNSFAHEIMSLEEITKNYNFNNLSTAGQAKYDIEKLLWVNHKWISKYNAKKLLELCLPFLEQAYPQTIKNISTEKLQYLLSKIQTDLHTLAEIVPALKFYFKYEQIHATLLASILPETQVVLFLEQVKQDIQQAVSEADFVQKCKQNKPALIASKEYWGALRFILTGSQIGLAIHDIVEGLGLEVARTRILNV